MIHFIIEKLISSASIDEISTFIHQENTPVTLNNIFIFLKDKMICALLSTGLMKCPECDDIYVGIHSMALHIKERHQVAGVYYKNIRLKYNFGNLDPLDPPSIIYFCSYCGFPTSDTYGRNPTTDMNKHIAKECGEAAKSARENSGRWSTSLWMMSDPNVIKEYISKKPTDARICGYVDCNHILISEESVISHYLEKHADETKFLIQENKLKQIIGDPSTYLSREVGEFEKLKKEKDDYIDAHRLEIESELKKLLGKYPELVCFTSLWMPKNMILQVDMDKVANELLRYPEGIATDKLTQVIFNDKTGIQKFSLCYALQSHSNYVYDFTTDTWKIRPDLFSDAFDDSEILSGKKSPGPREKSKIQLEEEPRTSTPFSMTYKEMTMDIWKRVKKDEISYILFFAYIYNGYLPYDEKAQKLFPPYLKRAHFTAEGGKKFRVKIDKDKRAVYSQSLEELFKDAIAGTVVYLRRLDSEGSYKIYFKEAPQIVKDCRIVKYDEASKLLIYETKDLEVKYECVPPIFKAELRFQDIQALWEEARRVGYSISDLTYLQFSELAKDRADRTAHFNDIYGRVFFKRMCSPGGVWSILKHHPSYYEYTGNKVWKFIGEKFVSTPDTQEVGVHMHWEKKVIAYTVVFLVIILILLFVFKIIFK